MPFLKNTLLSKYFFEQNEMNVEVLTTKIIHSIKSNTKNQVFESWKCY